MSHTICNRKPAKTKYQIYTTSSVTHYNSLKPCFVFVLKSYNQGITFLSFYLFNATVNVSLHVNWSTDRTDLSRLVRVLLSDFLSFYLLMATVDVSFTFEFAHGQNKPKQNNPISGPPVIPNKLNAI